MLVDKYNETRARATRYVGVKCFINGGRGHGADETGKNRNMAVDPIMKEMNAKVYKKSHGSVPRG